MLEADARAAYDYLRVTRNIAPARIVIYGWSLGGAVAVNLAAQTEQAAVILEGAPASLVDIGQRRYPFFPIRLIMRNPFNSIGKIERIRSPMLFPARHGRRGHSDLGGTAAVRRRTRRQDVRGGPRRARERERRR